MRYFRALPLILACLEVCLAFAAPALAKKTPPPLHSVDLNAAGVKELEELPGVGATTANAIIQFRIKSGRFHRVEDLLAIRGISAAKLNRIRPYVTLGSAAPPSSKPAAPKKPAASGAAGSSPAANSPK